MRVVHSEVKPGVSNDLPVLKDNENENKGAEREQEVVGPTNKVDEKDSLNQHCSEIKEANDVERGDICSLEKLVQCDNCKKIYRSSNLTRHKRSCMLSSRRNVESELKERGVDTPESMEQEIVDKTDKDADASCNSKSLENKKSFAETFSAETKRQSKSKEPPLKVKLFNRKSKRTKKGCTASAKKTSNKSKLVSSEAKTAKTKNATIVKDARDNSSVDTTSGTSRSIVQKERPKNKVCQFCQKTFSRIKQLQEHIRTHTGEKPFQCALCGSTFAAEKTLDQHMKVHTGEKPYKCNVCGHACSQLGNLQRHMRSHTNERPFLCTQCGFAFKEKNHLDGHVRIHTGERPYECKECHRRFSVSSSLQCHMRTHTGVKPVSCEYCGKKFARRTSLNEHIGKHLGVKIECEQCGAVFSHKRSLVSHMQIHETHKYACSQCGKTFYRRRNLTRHLEMHERRKRKKAMLTDGVISNSADICLGLTTQLNEEAGGGNLQPDNIPHFNLQSLTTSEDQVVNNTYKVSQYLNTFSHTQLNGMAMDPCDRAGGCQESAHPDREYNNAQVRSVFQEPVDTLTDDAIGIRKNILTDSCGSNNLENKGLEKTKQDLSDTLCKTDHDFDREAVSIQEQSKEVSRSEDQIEYSDNTYKDEIEEAENSSCSSVLVSDIELAGTDQEENMVIVKQETVDEDGEYGQSSELVRTETSENDKDCRSGQAHDCAEKSVKHEDDEFKTCEVRKPTDHKYDSDSEPDSNVIVKVENEDDSSSDNTVIMEPNDMMDELKQYQEKGKKYACLYCTKKFSKSIKLKDHVRTHTGERPYQCEHCGSAFATVHTLKVHKRIHTGVKPYKCKVCGHAFSQLANLQSHLRTHSSERPFLCPQCGYAFKEKAHLEGHMFLHTGEKPFECSMCDKRFPNKSALNTHKKIHLGVKPFKCQYCEKRFPRPYQLSEHLRTHTGNKITCEICGHAFTHMSSYRTHMRVHEEGRKYECSKCGKKFARKRNLKRHAEMKIKPCS